MYYHRALQKSGRTYICGRRQLIAVFRKIHPAIPEYKDIKFIYCNWRLKSCNCSIFSSLCYKFVYLWQIRLECVFSLGYAIKNMQLREIFRYKGIGEMSSYTGRECRISLTVRAMILSSTAAHDIKLGNILSEIAL